MKSSFQNSFKIRVETIYFYPIVEAVFNKVLRLKQRQRDENFWSATFGLLNSSFDPIYKECPLTL